MTVEILHGDCLEHLAALKAAGRTFASIVTDPPYGLGFMGKHWDAPDSIAFRPNTWRAALDVLEPGGMLATFAGPRTQHRMAVAIEDAGFQLFDCALWLYGTGWARAKTQLKPAYEPILLARKPTKGPLRPLAIDHCRVGTETITQRQKDMTAYHGNKLAGGIHHGIVKQTGVTTQTVGRWPASVCHDGSDEVLAALGPKARFFYAAKVSKVERAGSEHPTMKPLSLVSWVVRLINPPAGTVLDFFAGSGTTGLACQMAGFDCVLVEREAEYIADIQRRLALPELAAE